VQGPEKSWNCICKISRTWEVLENEFGSGKSGKSKCKVLESPGICSAMIWTANTVMWMQAPKYARLHTSILCLNSFCAISPQHVTVMNIYSSMDAAIILYIYIYG